MTFTDDPPATLSGHGFGHGPGPSARHVDADAGDRIQVESAGLLFRGDYVRDGADLVVTGGGERLVVHGYFHAPHRPTLVAPNGAHLSDAVVEALARPAHGIQVAQAGTPPSPDPGAPIGRVQTATGTVSIVRNGASLTLHTGDLVHKGDVVQTGAASSVAISFLDGTLFSLAGNARMVLSDMVYKAGASDNHSLFNLVQGQISFVAGKVAKTGDMKVGTPVATMGIRGTFVGADIEADDGTSRLSVKTEPPSPEHPEGHTGRFDVYDPNDPGHLLFTVSDPSTAYVVHPDGGAGISYETVPKTPEELAREAQLTQDIFRTLAQTPRLPITNGPGANGGTSSGDEPGQVLPNPALQPPSGATPGQPVPGGTNRGDPPQTDPGRQTPQQHDQPHAEAPIPAPVADNPPAATLDLSPLTASVIQDEVRTGAADQGVLAAAGTAARVVAAHAGSSADTGLTDGSLTLQGQYGTLTLHADGSYIYRADNAAALAEGQHGTDVFSVAAQQGAATGTTTLTVEVTGVNDVPVLARAAALSIAEQAGQTGSGTRDQAAGRVSFADPDLTDTHAAAVDGTPSVSLSTGAAVPAGLAAGLASALAVSVDEAGHAVAYGFSAPDKTFDFLAAGETLSVTYDLSLSDGHGGTAHTPVTVTVIGAEDPPVVSGLVTGTATEDGPVSRLDALANAAAVDDGAHLSVTGVPDRLPAGVTYDAASHSFTLDPGDAAYQHLAAGQTATVSVAYGVTDGTATTPASVAWTVTGTEDPPAVSGTVTGTATEDGPSSRLDALANAATVDDGAQLAVIGVPERLPAGVTYEAATHSFALDPGDAAYQHLAAGQTTTVTVAYGVTDGTATTPASVSWIVTGVEDPPVVSGPVVGTATEDGAVSLLDALANASDPDDGVHLAVTGVPGGLPAGVTYDPATHSFTLDPGDAAYQHLAAGETATVSVAYGVTDGTATTSASVSWTITGVEDPPVVSGPVTGTATEDGAVSRLDALANAAAVDDGAQLAVTGVPDHPPAGVTYDAAYHSFTLDPSNAAYQHLAAGETATVSVAYGVTDGTATTPASVSWIVTGVEDPPVVSGPVTGTATEDGAVSRLDALANASDPDDGAHLAVIGVPDRLPAGVTYAAASHSFTLDPVDAAYQHLSAGQTTTVSVAYGVTDGTATTPASVSWTVTGINEAPTFDSAPGLAVAELPHTTGSDTPDTATGRVGFSDPDVADTHTVTVESVLIATSSSLVGLPPGLAASLASALTTQVDEAGHGVTYGFSAPDKTFDFLPAGDTLVLTYDLALSDGHGGTAHTPVTVTVAGANDAPAIGGDQGLSVASGGSVVLTSTALHASDPDNSAGQLTYAIASDPNAHGYFTLGTGSAHVTSFTQAQIDAGAVAYHRDGTLAGHASDTIAFTLSDGTDSASGHLAVSVTGPFSQYDQVVLASDDYTGSIPIPTEALLFNDSGTPSLGVDDVRQTGIGSAELSGASVTFTPYDQYYDDQFAYRAIDGSGQVGNLAYVAVDPSHESDFARLPADGGNFSSVAVGAGEDSNILIASRYSPTALYGNYDDLTGAARTGHDVFVFTQDPTDSSVFVHTIFDFSAANDAIDLPFLNGTAADESNIGQYVRIMPNESGGFDIQANSNGEGRYYTVAHVADENYSLTQSITVIWHDHLAQIGHALPVLA